MNTVVLNELRNIRGEKAQRLESRETEKYRELMTPTIADLRDTLDRLGSAPGSVRASAERCLDEYVSSESDSKPLRSAIENLRRAATGALFMVVDRPAQVAHLLARIDGVNPESFIFANARVLAAADQQTAAPLIFKGDVGELVTDLARLEAELHRVAAVELERERKNGGESVAKTAMAPSNPEAQREPLRTNSRFDSRRPFA